MSQRALFLDRDGVINIDHGYVYTPDRTEFVPGIFELVRAANAADHLVVVVTNQAGIARGYYTEQEFLDYMGWMRREFLVHEAHIDDVFFCPHHPEVGHGDLLQSCRCRKPAPGMILDAEAKFGFDLSRSILVGDKMTDIEAGRAAGVGTNILLGEEPFAALGSVTALFDGRR